MIYIYIGLPGSGKSFMAKQDREKLGGLLFDDGIEQLSLNHNKLKEAIINKSNVFIADPNLCFEDARLYVIGKIRAIDGNVEIKEIWFENNSAKAIDNIAYRNDNRVVSAASIRDYFSRNYKIPSNITPIKIWQKEDDV